MFLDETILSSDRRRNFPVGRWTKKICLTGKPSMKTWRRVETKTRKNELHFCRAKRRICVERMIERWFDSFDFGRREIRRSTDPHLLTAFRPISVWEKHASHSISRIFSLYLITILAFEAKYLYHQLALTSNRDRTSLSGRRKSFDGRFSSEYVSERKEFLVKWRKFSGAKWLDEYRWTLGSKKLATTRSSRKWRVSRQKMVSCGQKCRSSVKL